MSQAFDPRRVQSPFPAAIRDLGAETVVNCTQAGYIGAIRAPRLMRENAFPGLIDARNLATERADGVFSLCTSTRPV